MGTSEESTPIGPFAHTLADRPPAEWEPLEEHLVKVSETAADYAAAFGARAWGELLGRCHDLGKASLAFQNYLRVSGDGAAEDAAEDAPRAKRVDHKTYGARFVAEAVPAPIGQMLAFCIAGHHGGLPDEHADGEMRGTLRWRLDPQSWVIPAVARPAIAIPALRAPLKLAPDKDEYGFQFALLTRMLFSCLVDADRTCTEAFCNPEQAEERRVAAVARPGLSAMKAELDGYLEWLKAGAADTAVNSQREAVQAQCRAAAEMSPGFFSLQVPTGGGKTLSSLVFALGHAVENGMRRVVFAIPFTSIVEQTAEVYRRALGPLGEDAVVEHHMSVEPARETRANKLGAENWDAPLVVTTNVQLLESLFAAKTTPCRKLHNLAGSVIILDEAQSIPVEYLKPVLAVLRELVRNYGCSVVLCTATQPALEWRDDFAIGLQGVRPIIVEAAPLYAALRRVEVVHLGRVADDELTRRLVEQPAVLCIVNTKRHAAILFAEVHSRCEFGTCFHLSTWMCGAHRREVLAEVKQRLKAELPCRLVSTQLVEAGVDVDFPEVYRAEAGFDSIAQAAGRCNREGRRALGYTYVFEAETRPPPGVLRSGADTARELRGLYPDPLAPQAVEAYFRQHYWQHAADWDRHRVMEATSLQGRRLLLQFRTVEERFVLIPEKSLPLLIPHGAQGRALWDKLSLHQVPFVSQRFLQPYLVSVPERAMHDLVRKGFASEHASGVWLLDNLAVYDREMGLDVASDALDERSWSV